MNDLLVASAVLFAALLHATWNALLKSGADRMVSLTVMQTTTSVLAGFGLLFVPLPAAECWPYLVMGMALHYAYRMTLVYGYNRAELGEIYPIARGTAPPLVTVGAAIFAGDRVTVLAVVGIALVSLGIFLLRRSVRPSISGRTLLTGLTIGAIIACYTIVDGMGARVSGNPVGYTLVLFSASGLTTLLTYLFLRGWRLPPTTGKELSKGVASSAVSMLAYGTVIWALTHGLMGSVSALRETSVLFAALIGAIFLNERFTFRRMLACTIVVIGAVCLGLA